VVVSRRKVARRVGSETPRLAAIRAIIELARDGGPGDVDDVEGSDAAVAALLVLGVSPHEITAATLGRRTTREDRSPA
jgi:hypothetical protein